ncbi:MarR family winged helix-turn-helix transcriptional regulator [Cohnella rhizosphaerae]|uniref:MarR family transcriptional regulator n=1 Tax=Cohnella rhizosphaerae TaxID=1457232 RepID=A0A9X4KS58_9BACL|nr:MarR family transcriptional regulator [Cohnella rhizosphaerae]MDG0809558.1 MarR family transcriptional regulator [Cohnella rhizosphaerae]
MLLRATHYIQQEFEARLSSSDLPFPLSGSRIRLLLTVWGAGTIRMNELAGKLGVKARTVTEQVDALERDGLIRRIADPYDRRATLLELTDEARCQVHRIKARQAQISESLLRGFTAQQRSELSALLTIFFEGKETDVSC